MGRNPAMITQWTWRKWLLTMASESRTKEERSIIFVFHFHAAPSLRPFSLFRVCFFFVSWELVKKMEKGLFEFLVPSFHFDFVDEVPCCLSKWRSPSSAEKSLYWKIAFKFKEDTLTEKGFFCWKRKIFSTKTIQASCSCWSDSFLQRQGQNSRVTPKKPGFKPRFFCL